MHFTFVIIIITYLFSIVIFICFFFTHEYNMLRSYPSFPAHSNAFQTSPLTFLLHFYRSNFLIYTVSYYLGLEFDHVPRCLLSMCVKDTHGFVRLNDKSSLMEIFFSFYVTIQCYFSPHCKCVFHISAGFRRKSFAFNPAVHYSSSTKSVKWVFNQKKTLSSSDFSCLLICNLHMPTNSSFISMLIEQMILKHLKTDLKAKIGKTCLSISIQFLANSIWMASLKSG